ncbi:hypothetical protein [Chryseobacterium pennipullorum]|uniref:Uncharacterized protein n=1 Tax=Chryseobacterium pennipullorum TaxID=2258963 RepID=A0A3D9AMN7_9FLAO|nr:hypothetical protein [Chryseobacterium pennipullorum]REC42362.1 hypothetical protein DRF67_20655 [Chryseobacterium pennipullorum]
METTVQHHKEQVQYAEVYITDMWALKNIFLNIQNASKVNQDFGLPFFLARKKNEIILFASLIISGTGRISFKIYEKRGLAETDKRAFALKVENYFKKSTAPNFRNPEQLKSSISRTISWLNLE